MELNSVLAQIVLHKKEVDNLQPVKPEFERMFWEKFRLEFNYNSNHMEGNTLTYGHTQILLRTGDVVGKYNIRELQEMKAHDLALKIIRESASDPEFELSQKFIREINQTILVEPFYNEAITPEGKSTQKLIVPGEYKKTPNSVRLPNGEMHHYPSPEETPALMGDLMDWYEKESKSKELHPVQIAALFHYKLVQIHPFDDSNGRTARLLMNFILLKNDYAPLVIESNDKKNYLIALNEADAGNINAFVEYIIILSERWQELYVKALKGEKIEEPEDFDKEIELLKKKISEKNKVKKIFSKEATVHLLDNSFSPLLEKIINKLSSLDQFYYTKEIRFGINGPNSTVKNIAEIKKIFEDQIASITANSSIDLLHIFKGLQTQSSGVVDFHSYLKIRFNEFTYQISRGTPGEWFLEKKYDESLSEKDTDVIVSNLAKEALIYIKNHQ